jgi:hypothetical protein
MHVDHRMELIDRHLCVEHAPPATGVEQYRIDGAVVVRAHSMIAEADSWHFGRMVSLYFHPAYLEQTVCWLIARSAVACRLIFL